MKSVLILLLLQAAVCLAELDNSVDVTGEAVKQVESLISKDPKLPRLTRGEIISLLQEVRNVSGERDKKSLMVVLPVNGSNSSLEDLYTAAPVTTMVGEPASSTTKRPKRKRKKPTPPRPVYVHSTAPAQTSSVGQPDIKGPYVTTTKPKNQDFQLPQPMKEALEEISVHPQPERPIFVTPMATPKPTSAPVPQDVIHTAENLSPDLKELLNSFGLLGQSGKTTTTGRPTFQLKPMAPSVDPSSFSRFKPLPSGIEVNDDMRSFLGSFGLLEPSRKKKAMREPAPDASFINEDILTNDMKKVLQNIGLLDKKDKKGHVFNPQDLTSKLNQTDEMHKISRIMKKLREFTEGKNQNLTQEELKELLLLESAQESSNSLQDNNTLNPINDINQGIDPNKNEVKRQQPNTTDATSSASSSASVSGSVSASASASASATGSNDGDSDAIETTTSGVSDSEGSETGGTESAVSESTDSTERSPSLDDLADSFGGDTSTKRPNGLYFLLDWNSFLDVGLDQRKITLNFSPKVGDPRNFLPVTVP